jgi:ATP-dependent RNA helicase DDX1
MGFSTIDASLNLGLFESNANITCLGTDDKAFGFGGTGKKSHAGKFEDYGESFTFNDVIGCFLDLISGTVHFSKNGKEFSTAFHIPSKLLNSAFYPSILLKVCYFYCKFLR